MKLKNVKVLLPDGYRICDLSFDERIKDIEVKDDNMVNYKGNFLIPGLFDIHTHGGNGFDFNNAQSLQDMQSILNFYIANGVTSVFPTMLTDSDESLKKHLNMIAQLAKTNPIIKGIHLEGPFLSKEYKGAQNEEYLQKLSIDKFNEYQHCANGLIKYITISPELENTKEFVRYLVSQRIRVSLGHSGATFDQATVAVNEGSVSFTHVMNAMAPLSQHNPSILAAAFYYSQCYNEVICDGIHVHPEMVKFIFKIKGCDKVIGITDSLMAAGLKDGEYKIGTVPIIVKDHDCKLKQSGVRAGSTLTAINGFKNVKKFLSADDQTASKIFSFNAARMLSMDKDIGSIEVNKCADFVMLNENYEVENVYINGKPQLK